MVHLSDILDHVPAALLVIFRLGGLMIAGPVLGSSAIPPRVRILLAFALGIAVYPLLDGEQTAAARSFLHADAGVLRAMDLWSLAPVVGVELLVGMLIGFMAGLPLMAAQLGGLMMGQQMGLGFAQFFNPAIDDEADVMGQILYLMVLAGFLLVGGHESMVLGVLDSFRHVPVPAAASFAPDAGVVAVLVGLLTAALELSLRVAAPLLAVIFLHTVAMGLVARTVPQMNILSFGFAVRVLGGLAIVVLGLVVIDEVMMEGIDEAWSVIFSWIESP